MSERENIIEVMARAVCAANEVNDEIFVEEPLHNRWIEDATAALLALEAAGVRLVTQATIDDWFDRLKHGDEKHQTWLRDEMNKLFLAASPYAKENGNG